jgi:ribosomal protein S18 acetylase RimI-like enzyme
MDLHTASHLLDDITQACLCCSSLITTHSLLSLSSHFSFFNNTQHLLILELHTKDMPQIFHQIPSPRLLSPSSTSSQRQQVLYYRPLQSETADLPAIQHLVSHGLSEPYSVYTYRHFLRNYPLATWLAVVRSFPPPAVATAASDDGGGDNVSLPPLDFDSYDKRVKVRDAASTSAEDWETLECEFDTTVGCVVCKIDDVQVQHEEVYWDDTSSEEEEEEEQLPPPPSVNKPQSTSKLGSSFKKPEPTTTTAITTAEKVASTKAKKALKREIKEMTGATQKVKQGYLGMLSVDPNFRRLGIGGELIGLGIGSMVASIKGSSPSTLAKDQNVSINSSSQRSITKGYSCHRVSLEAETTNVAALRQYEACGFQKVDYLQNYYLNMGDAVRLVLYVSREEEEEEDDDERGVE